MVFHKRLDCRYNGYQAPSFPRASRSERGKGLFKRKADDREICAIELLATVAENLLEEGEDSQSPSNIEDEKVQPFIVKDFEEEKPLEPCNPGSCDESVRVSDFTLLVHNQNKNLKAPQHPKHDMGLERNSIIAKSSCSEKFDHAEVVACQKRNEFMKLLRKVDGGYLGYGELHGNIVNRMEGQLESETEKQITNAINSTLQDACGSEDPMELDIKPPTLVSSDSTIQVPHTSFLPFQTDLKLVCKDDDDENSSGCTQLSTGNLKAFMPPPRIGDRRIRRLLASKYWKVAPRLNNRELSNNGMGRVFRNAKACYIRQRTQRNSNFRRKLFEHRLISRSEEGAHGECISKSSKKNKAATGSANRASLVAAHESSLHSRDSRVKLSIKSFRVPELFIEIPETATVGSLKRTVREAVNAILSGGLCVGVVLQGKKVKDDDKTLLQTGISHDDKLDALGFMLEPNSSPAPQHVKQEDTPFLVSCDVAQPLSSYPKTCDGDLAPSDASPNPVGSFVGNGLDLIPTALLVEKAELDSRTLIASPKTAEPLAVPLNGKCRQSEQRRMRRPYAVPEVEALVQAVEKLGTGRWRDIKLYAFEKASHRTYVDLKDKWKTLVHTARIAPHQRRGEPVPQELLDRVLAAHAHWSQQHTKQQQIKQQQTETSCLHLSYNLIEDQMGGS